jgi:hypothetical protein
MVPPFIISTVYGMRIFAKMVFIDAFGKNKNDINGNRRNLLYELLHYLHS